MLIFQKIEINVLHVAQICQKFVCFNLKKKNTLCQKISTLACLEVLKSFFLHFLLRIWCCSFAVLKTSFLPPLEFIDFNEIWCGFSLPPYIKE